MDLSGDADETLLPDPESPPTSVAPWTEVEVSFERAGSETVGGEKASVDQEDGWTNVHRLPDPDLVDSNPPEDRADFLTRQATEAFSAQEYNGPRHRSHSRDWCEPPDPEAGLPVPPFRATVDRRSSPRSIRHPHRVSPPAE